MSEAQIKSEAVIQPSAQPNQAILIVAIVVLSAAVAVTGWALVKMYSGPSTGKYEATPEGAQAAAFETEIQLAIQRKLGGIPVLASGVKAERAGEIKGEEIYRYTANWRPQVDLYVKGPPSKEPATLSPKGLADVFVEWIKQNPEKAKAFTNVANPVAKFTTLTPAATTTQDMPVTGTIQVIKSSAGGLPTMVVSFDAPVLTEGQPAYKFGPHALPAGSKDYASLLASKQLLQESINQGLVEAYRLDMLRGDREVNQDVLKKAEVLVKSVKQNDPADTLFDKERQKAIKEDAANGTKAPVTFAEALDDAKKKQAELDRMKKARAEKQAEMEKQRQEYMAPLLEATKAGRIWTGALTEVRTGPNKETITLVYPIEVRFLTQTDSGEFTGIVCDPAAPEVNKTFAGRILPPPTAKDPYTLSLATTADSGITPQSDEDARGSRAWLQKGDSYHLFANLSGAKEMIGRTSRRASLSLKLVEGK
jgi:uncharacterized protein (DUF2147 family)